MRLSARVRFTDPQIELVHGAGGKAMRRLIEGLFLPRLTSPALAALGDAAVLEVGGLRLALTTDAFVVTPHRFPGGSIGELAVNGTVNDLAMAGARPLALVAAFILEAGLPVAALEAEVEAMARAAARAGVAVVGGDTKVVEHGQADGLYIATTGLGLVDPRAELGPARVRPGDKILVSGPIGDHGVTVLLARGELDLEADLVSDTRPLWPLVEGLLAAVGPGLRWLRDPTRGGVASALNELARDTGLGIVLWEEAVPVRPAVRGACEVLGLDPLYIACEGQFLAVVDPAVAELALRGLQALPGGAEAVLIGEVRPEPAATLVAVTAYGGARVVDMLVGDPLPRIC